MGWLPVVVGVAVALDDVAQRARRLKASFRSGFYSYHEQRAAESLRMVETLERDLIEAARSEGQALDQLRRAQEEIAKLKASKYCARCGKKCQGVDCWPDVHITVKPAHGRCGNLSPAYSSRGHHVHTCELPSGHDGWHQEGDASWTP